MECVSDIIHTRVYRASGRETGMHTNGVVSECRTSRDYRAAAKTIEHDVSSA